MVSLDVIFSKNREEVEEVLRENGIPIKNNIF